MVERSDIEIKTRDGTTLAAWFYRPRGTPEKRPCIVMSHGFTGLREHALDPYATNFADAGFSVILYDHRGFGDSAGEPRLEADPFQQMHDMRDVVTHATLSDRVDENRIGIWGTSYSGGHVLIVGAVDRRVKCVVSVVPVTSGSGVGRRLLGEMNWDARLAEFAEVRKKEMQGQGVQYQKHTTYPESLAFFAQVAPNYVNKSSVLSHEMFMEYEPGDYVERISPTPLLMIVADHDTRVCTDLQLEAFAKAREPKKLVILKGGHYDPYVKLFSETSAASVDWFKQYLL